MPLARLPSRRCRRAFCSLPPRLQAHAPKTCVKCRLRRRRSSCPTRRWSSASAPAVVNVYAARVVENRNPFMNDPLFRQFFGAVPREQVLRSLGSGVIVDPSGLVVTNYHVIEGASEVKVALADKREFDAEIVLKDEHSDLSRAAPQGRERNVSRARLRQFRRSAGRRRGAGDRRSVRRRPDRDPRHRLGARAHAGRHQRLSVLHPDRRRDQSGQFRRRAGRYQRPARRHQHRDLFALGRLAGHRFCDPGEHGARRGRFGQRRQRRSQAAVARRQAARGDAGDRRQPRASSGRAARWWRASTPTVRPRAPASRPAM